MIAKSAATALARAAHTSPGRCHQHPISRRWGCRRSREGKAWSASVPSINSSTKNASISKNTCRASTGKGGSPFYSLCSETFPSLLEPGTPRVPFYSDLPLDRAGHLRSEAEKLQKLWASPSARLVPIMQRSKALARPSKQHPGLKTPVMFRPAAKAAEQFGVSDFDAIFLGLGQDGEGVFAIAVSEEAGRRVKVGDAEWLDARQSGSELDETSAAILALAAGLVTWNKSNTFCPNCGGPMAPVNGGHARRCTARGAKCRTAYPRIDPAAIMLVTCGDYALLGHQARWSPGRFSCLAGFLEVGETLEMNVAREVLEETAVRVDLASVEYVQSQPWPFPRSLMVGFRANAPPREATPPGYDGLSAEGREAAIATGLRPQEAEDALFPTYALQVPQPDTKELEEAAWFHKEWVRSALQGSQTNFYHGGETAFGLPGPQSMARQIIEQWLAEGRAEPQWEAGASFQDVNIDNGVFKYVMARVHGQGGSKLVVWGDCRAGYHNQVFQRIRGTARAAGLEADVLGGGRIEHHPEQGVCFIYGYSVAFGPAAHEVAAAIVRRAYPRYRPEDVTTSYEGY